MTSRLNHMILIATAAATAFTGDFLLTLKPAEAKKTDVRGDRKSSAGEEGLASFYSTGAAEMTAAHKTLPMNSRARVINSKTGHSIEVRISDRGPFVPGRVIDLLKKAAAALGINKQGVASVKVVPLSGK